MKEHSIEYEKEKTFETLRGKNQRALRFDFYVYGNEGQNYLIEYDGKQHYKKDRTGYGTDLENIQKRDFIKSRWALKNKIPLIRIPYTHFSELQIEDLILSTSKFIIQGDDN